MPAHMPSLGVNQIGQHTIPEPFGTARTVVSVEGRLWITAMLSVTTQERARYTLQRRRLSSTKQMDRIEGLNRTCKCVIGPVELLRRVVDEMQGTSRAEMYRAGDYINHMATTADRSRRQ